MRKQHTILDGLRLLADQELRKEVPDGCTRGETVFDPESEELLIQVPPLSEEKPYPKEQALVDLVAAERLQGRRVLVYATHTGTRDITARMDEFLTRHGFKVAVMKADAVPPERREAWVAKRVEESVDVLVCHPRLVQTGLDLVEFPTICWYETEVSVFQSTPNAPLLVGDSSAVRSLVSQGGALGSSRNEWPPSSRGPTALVPEGGCRYSRGCHSSQRMARRRPRTSGSVHRPPWVSTRQTR